MARLITLTPPEWGVTNGMELSFKAPCNCTDVTGISLAGVEYEIVDASGNSLTSCSNYFAKDAILTVIIDTVNKTATLLNPRVNTYTKSLGTPDDTASTTGTTVWARVKQVEAEVSEKAPLTHNHDDSYYTKAQVDTKLDSKASSYHIHDGRYYTETEIDTKLGNLSTIKDGNGNVLKTVIFQLSGSTLNIKTT